VSEDGRIVPGTLSLSPASYGAKNEDTTVERIQVDDKEIKMLYTIPNKPLYKSLEKTVGFLPFMCRVGRKGDIKQVPRKISDFSGCLKGVR